MNRIFNPPHPGLTLRDDVLPALGLGVTQAAEQLGVSRVALSRVLNGRAAVSPDMALRLEAWLTSNCPRLWSKTPGATAASNIARYPSKSNTGHRSDGDVVLTRATQTTSEDPVMGQFLSFLAHDMATHPQRLAALDARLVQGVQSLVGGVTVDLDAALSAEDE